MSTSSEGASAPLLDRELVDQIKSIGRASGRSQLLEDFIGKLEANLAGFGRELTDCAARADGASAGRAAHALKGAARQMGALALGNLFAEIERAAKAGDCAEAQRRFEGGADLIARSVEALKRA